MSNSAVNVEVRLKMQDAGVDAGLKAVQGAAEKAAAASVAATEKAATAMERAAEKAAADAERSAARQRSSYERLSHAREALGMRSEHAIQREIDKTVAAYNRLSDSGALSFKEQTRAAEAMRAKVEQLTNEMGKLTNQQKIMAGIKTAAAIGAGITAAGYVLRDPAKAAMSYDERLAAMANTAYAERDVAGRKIGMGQLEAAINRAVGKGGGGTRDQAAEALDMLIASGAIGINDAMAMLPSLMRASAATSTDALQLAQIGVRGQATMALIGMLNNREYMSGVLAKVRAADVTQGGAVETNYGVVSSMSGFKLRQAEQQKDIAQKAAMDELTPAIGKVAELFGDMVAQYPLLSGATIAATGAISAFAAAAGGAALVLNGGKLPGVGGAIDRAGRLGKGVGPLGKSAGKTALNLVKKHPVLATVAVAGTSWEIGTSIAKATDSGGHLWEWFNGDKMRAQKQAETELAKLRAANHPAPRMQADVTVSVTDDRVHVTRARLATKGVDATMNTGNVHTGAPR